MPTMRERTSNYIRFLKARIGAFLLQRASGKRKTLSDRLFTRLLDLVSSNLQPDHFMRDEIIDADIGFDPKELDQYQQLSDQQVVDQ